MVQLPNPYASKHYYLLGIIPVILVVIALFFIPSIPKGIDLKGGTLITIQSPNQLNSTLLENEFSNYSNSVSVNQISSPTGYGTEVQLENSNNFDQAGSILSSLSSLDFQLSSLQQSGSTDPSILSEENSISTNILSQSSKVLDLVGSKKSTGSDPHAAVILAQNEYSSANSKYLDSLRQVVLSISPNSDVSVQQVGSTLSKQFLSQAQQIVVYAFIFSALAVFILFRSLGPSIAVIFGAIADITITAGVMGILQIPLTLPSIATLLMLIGFSLDTDVMLTIRVMQRKEGTPASRAANALVTGGMMNLTTIGAFGVLYVIGTFLSVPTYQEIGAVAVIGGFADFIATWCFNASLVLYFTEKMESAKKSINL